MLCTKPYLLYREHQKIVEQGYQGIDAGHTNGGGAGTAGGNALLSSDDNDDNDSDAGDHRQADGQMSGGFGGQASGTAGTEEMSEEHEFDMGEHVIHQVIRECRSRT